MSGEGWLEFLLESFKGLSTRFVGGELKLVDDSRGGGLKRGEEGEERKANGETRLASWFCTENLRIANHHLWSFKLQVFTGNHQAIITLPLHSPGCQPSTRSRSNSSTASSR